MLDSFAEDNKNFELTDSTSAREGIVFPIEKGYDLSQQMSDMKDVFPCFFVLGGSNGGAMLVSESVSYASVWSNWNILSAND